MADERTYIDVPGGLRLVPVRDLHGRLVRVQPWTDAEKAEFEREFEKEARKVATRLPVSDEQI